MNRQLNPKHLFQTWLFVLIILFATFGLWGLGHIFDIFGITTYDAPDYPEINSEYYTADFLPPPSLTTNIVFLYWVAGLLDLITLAAAICVLIIIGVLGYLLYDYVYPETVEGR